MDIRIKWVDGHAYVSLSEVVDLVITAQNQVDRVLRQQYAESAQKQAIMNQAQSITGSLSLGSIGNVNQLAASDNCGQRPAPSLGCHEEDYRGLSR